MKSKNLMIWLVGVLLMSACRVEVAVYEDGTGQELVQKAFAQMKQQNLPALEGFMAPGFQSIHSDGPRTKEQELALIKELNLGDYMLDAFEETHDGDLIVVTYTVSVTETIDGEVLSSKPAPRMSVFRYTHQGWQWMAHANLKPL
jgi:hypothetical protein